jgi:putative chitinase
MGLTNAKAFFDHLRAGLLGPTLSAEEVDGCNKILAAMDGSPLAWTAYALATAYHETASTMQPIKEYGGPTYFTRMYDVTGARPQLALKYGNTCAGDGPRYCGRGYVQLTWKVNYETASAKCGCDLVANPDRAMEPAIAAKVMRHGMTEGWFTGKKLSDYLGAKTDYVNARRIINGTDKAQTIAGYAQKFEAALKAGGEIKAPPVMPNPFDADPAPERDNPPAHPNLLTALVEMLKAIFRRRT